MRQIMLPWRLLIINKVLLVVNKAIVVVIVIARCTEGGCPRFNKTVIIIMAKPRTKEMQTVRESLHPTDGEAVNEAVRGRGY
jgi:hypothetical protein